MGCIVLAAGRSERFGAEDKLHALYRGRYLYQHAADALRPILFARHLIVCSSDSFPTPAGFERVVVQPGLPQSASVRAGIAALANSGMDAAMIALADMPCVATSHFQAVLDAFDPNAGLPVASGWEAGRPMPPAVFGRRAWPQLLALEGDEGARSLLRDAQIVLAERDALIDVDRVSDLR